MNALFRSPSPTSYSFHSCLHLRLPLILITFSFSPTPATSFININCHVHNVKCFSAESSETITSRSFYYRHRHFGKYSPSLFAPCVALHTGKHIFCARYAILTTRRQFHLALFPLLHCHTFIICADPICICQELETPRLVLKDLFENVSQP